MHSPCLCWEWKESDTGLTPVPSFLVNGYTNILGDNKRSSENLSLHSCLTGIQIQYLTFFKDSLSQFWPVLNIKHIHTSLYQQ